MTCPTASCERAELADGSEQARGGHEGRDAEQQRDARGDGGAEREQQDEQRAAGRELHRTSPRRRAPWRRAPCRRRVAELLDAQLAGGPSGPRRRRRAARRRLLELRGLDASASPGSVKLTTTERPSSETVLGAVLRVERALDVADALDLAEATDDVLHGGGDLRIVGLDRALALDQDALADRLGEAGGGDDHVAALGLAVAHRRRLDVLLADLAADRRWRGRRRGSSRGWRSCGGWHSICRRVPRGCEVAWGLLGEMRAWGPGQIPSAALGVPGGGQASGEV